MTRPDQRAEDPNARPAATIELPAAGLRIVRWPDGAVQVVSAGWRLGPEAVDALVRALGRQPHGPGEAA